MEIVSRTETMHDPDGLSERECAGDVGSMMRQLLSEVSFVAAYATNFRRSNAVTPKRVLPQAPEWS